MKRLNNKWGFLCLVIIALAAGYYYLLPPVLFNDPYSTVLEDRNGELLSAMIARDGQWRFPPLDSVPEKFARALIAYEDKRFAWHPGVDVLSLGRAIVQNLKSGKTVSGGSTISMQLIRMSRKGKPRTYSEKVIEMIMATRLELRYSKKEILSLYASHAPFGGNVVGLEAACWRYFGRDLHELSWAEAATLAVLPNSPSLVHPGKNRTILKARRDQLLDRLLKAGTIDSMTCLLAKAEDIPDEPSPLPRFARHLLQRVIRDGHSQQRVMSTIDLKLQKRVEEVVQEHHQRLAGSQVRNAAALVLDVQAGNVLAYVGNVYAEDGGDHGEEVDVIISPRSTGSILKPFLFAAMLDEGKILTNTLLPDVPIVINGFAPKNFSREFDGAVPASQALIRSLNVPAVHMLQQYRYEKFHSLLKSLGMSTLNRPPDHYGLSLILGGAEGKLWDITGMYASMARTMNQYDHAQSSHGFAEGYVHPPMHHRMSAQNYHSKPATLSTASIYLTFDVLKEVFRPGEESGWRNFYNSKKIAWKTGTSFGHRDGWAVGVTPDYAVGVWTGNADGEGRPGLTGTETAAPIMFDVFNLLPGSTWFQLPYSDMDQIAVCASSGLRLSPYCDAADTTWVTLKGVEARVCTYHKRIHVTPDRQHRVHSDCASFASMTSMNWFVLPPVQEYYYRPKNLSYKTLPPFREGCETSQAVASMDLVYPKPNARIFISRDLNGNPGGSVFELAHRDAATAVHWHLDGEYLGQTIRTHRMQVNPRAGLHKLTLVDGRGDVLERQFEVISN